MVKRGSYVSVPTQGVCLNIRGNGVARTDVTGSRHHIRLEKPIPSGRLRIQDNRSIWTNACQIELGLWQKMQKNRFQNLSIPVINNRRWRRTATPAQGECRQQWNKPDAHKPQWNNIEGPQPRDVYSFHVPSPVLQSQGNTT